jgi:hypothetical protein
MPVTQLIGVSITVELGDHHLLDHDWLGLNSDDQVLREPPEAACSNCGEAAVRAVDVAIGQYFLRR